MVTAGGGPVEADGPVVVRINDQVRSRFAWNAADFASGAADLHHLRRSRVLIATMAARRIRVRVQLQDSRSFGEETSTLTDGSADQIDFHEAHVEVEKLFDYPVQMRLGRQEMAFGGSG